MGLKKLVTNLQEGFNSYPNHNNPSTSGGYNYGSSTSIFDTGQFNQRSLKYDLNSERHNPTPLLDQELPAVNATPSQMGDGILDGFTRGGILVAGKRSIQDTKRIGKFLLTGNGLRFATTQIGLQKMNPRIQEGDPGGISSLLGDLGQQYFNTDFGLKSINRNYLPTNTLAQIPVNFTGLHFDRAGTDPTIPEEAKYINLHKKDSKFDGDKVGIFNNNEGLISGNRLLGLASSLGISGINTPSTQNNASETFNGLFDLGGLFTNVSDFITDLGSSVTNFLTGGEQIQTLGTLYEYGGGPASKAGIGKTVIQRYEITQGDLDTRGHGLTFSKVLELRGDYTNLKTDNDDGLRQTLIGNTINTGLPDSNEKVSGYIQIKENVKPKDQPEFGSEDGKIDETPFYDGASAINLPSRPEYTNTKILDNPLVSQYLKDIYGTETDKGKNYNIDSRVGIGEPGRNFSGKKENNYGVSIGSDTWRVDALNALDIQENESIKSFLPSNGSGRDLISFRFELVNTDDPTKADYLFFRAFLDSFDDSFKAKWNNVKYNGRAEELYTYGGFNRDIGVGFKIAAQSRAEMRPLYRKLNYLASTTAPDYGSSGRMRGNYVRLTVGDYLTSTPGFINNVNIKWNKEYPWEINMSQPENGDDNDGSTLILPHVLDVDISFTPIHDFVPRKGSDIPFIINDEQGWLSGGSRDIINGTGGSNNVTRNNETESVNVNSTTGPTSDSIVKQEAGKTGPNRYFYAKDATPIEGAKIAANGSAYYYKKGESGTWKQHKVGSSAEEAIAGVFGDNLI